MERTEDEPLNPACQQLLPMENLRSNRNAFEDPARQGLAQSNIDIELQTAGESRIDTEELLSSFCERDEWDFLEHLRRIDVPLLTADKIDDFIQTATTLNFPGGIRELLKKGRRDYCLSSIASASSSALSLGHDRVLKEMLSIDSQLGKNLLLEACRWLVVPADHPDDRIKCFRLILKEPDIDVQCKDDVGNTPLHYAAQAESIEAVDHLLKLGSSLSQRNDHGEPPLAYMSHGVLSGVFDNFICAVNTNKNDYEITFDYRNLIPHIATSQQPDEAQEEYPKNSLTLEMEALSYIAENRALQPLLKHPLLSLFLYIKWHRLRHVWYANLVFYITFYAFIHLNIMSTNYNVDSPSSSLPQSSNSTSTIPRTNSRNDLTAAIILMATVPFILAVRAINKRIFSPGHYFSSLEHMVDLLLTVLFVVTIVVPNLQIDVFLILLSTWQLLIVIGQCPSVSTPIEMLTIVTWTFLRFLFFYAIFIFAFALAFFKLFCNTKDNEHFLTLSHSLFKTIIMVTGEFDANDLPFVLHPVFSRCIFVLFVFLIAIVMLNLLNGLAVSNIADILKKSEVVALISRAKFLSCIEVAAVRLIEIFEGSSSDRAVCRRMFNLIKVLAIKTLIFPRDLPQRKISVKPYESNKIFVCGETNVQRNYINWSLDPLIMGQAREVLSRRESQRKEREEKRRIIAGIRSIKAELNVMRNSLDRDRRARRYCKGRKVLPE